MLDIDEKRGVITIPLMCNFYKKKVRNWIVDYDSHNEFHVVLSFAAMVEFHREKGL